MKHGGSVAPSKRSYRNLRLSDNDLKRLNTNTVPGRFITPNDIHTGVAQRHRGFVSRLPQLHARSFSRTRRTTRDRQNDARQSQHATGRRMRHAPCVEGCAIPSPAPPDRRVMKRELLA